MWGMKEKSSYLISQTYNVSSFQREFLLSHRMLYHEFHHDIIQALLDFYPNLQILYNLLSKTPNTLQPPFTRVWEAY